MRDGAPVPALWAAFTAKTVRLEAAVLLLASAVLVLAAVIGWYVVRGVPVYYIPPGGPGLSQPGSIPDAVALDFAGRWLTRRYTFIPATLTGAHQEVAATVHPQLGLPLKMQLEREAIWIKEHNVSCVSSQYSGVTRLTLTRISLKYLRRILRIYNFTAIY